MNINANFENIRDMAANAADLAMKKATAVAAIAKARAAIFTEENKIKKAEGELGRLYYHDYVSGNAADTEAYQKICDRITLSRGAIQEQRDLIARVKAENAAQGIIVEEDVPAEPDFVVETDPDFAVDAEEVQQIDETPAAAEPAEPDVSEEPKG